MRCFLIRNKFIQSWEKISHETINISNINTWSNKEGRNDILGDKEHKQYRLWFPRLLSFCICIKVGATHHTSAWPICLLSFWSNLAPNVCLTCPCIQQEVQCIRPTPSLSPRISFLKEKIVPYKFHYGVVVAFIHFSDAWLDLGITEMKTELYVQTYGIIGWTSEALIFSWRILLGST